MEKGLLGLFKKSVKADDRFKAISDLQNNKGACFIPHWVWETDLKVVDLESVAIYLKFCAAFEALLIWFKYEYLSGKYQVLILAV